ncbi:MAG TPA: hypothetical protein VK788_24780 [Terriglobales bacterium]|nr:hypothetical protein [Terriglobales bacterium]
MSIVNTILIDLRASSVNRISIFDYLDWMRGVALGRVWQLHKKNNA